MSREIVAVFYQEGSGPEPDMTMGWGTDGFLGYIASSWAETTYIETARTSVVRNEPYQTAFREEGLPHQLLSSKDLTIID